ncbi:MAG: hypothetical protein LBH47_03790 [Christensenellaceae bacterium]|nr:hypothetical protein [Christensenellaceae bacterium]
MRSPSTNNTNNASNVNNDGTLNSNGNVNNAYVVRPAVHLCPVETAIESCTVSFTRTSLIGGV